MFDGAIFSLARLSRASVCMDLIYLHVSRKPNGIAEHFARGGRLEVVCCETGRVLERGHGRAGVASLMRRLHENIDMQNLRISDVAWTETGFAYDWRCTARSWGSGPALATAGRVRAVFDGMQVKEFEIVCDAELYRELMWAGYASVP